ncbi:folliculin-interacting protein N-terminus-domain-containing protein [Phaeosphaeria sp. MPI-PUGE-AT-0046c]|nr:folliculin-interacting protein N-terminus-domain-containing protein [Phaeosphaeria sp. MPI-PUGE-AT-0046c]
MRPVPDMIGQFFSNRKGAGVAGASVSNTSSSTPATASTVLDSATEEAHTRFLLYPDSNAPTPPDGQPAPLHAAPLTPGSGHDGPLPEIDLEFPRDCRIIIAQDELQAMPKTILFDSKPAPPRPDSPPQSASRARAFGPGQSVSSAATVGPSFGGLHARRASLVAEPTAPRSPTFAGFTRIRTRGGSVSSMPNIDEHIQTAQAKAQARAKESSDLANICLDLQFGNLAMQYRGNSNKLHFLPLDNKPTDTPSLHTGMQDATGSLGRADGFRRRSHLAKSFTPANPPTDLPRADSNNDSGAREPKRRTIFITRMFSVPVPEENQESGTPTPQGSLPKGSGFPFPAASNNAPLSTSVPGQDSLGSSLDSDRRAGWAFVDPNLGVESLLSSSLSSDVDDRVDVVGQHWDVIMRAITSLQQVVQERIIANFKTPDSAPQQPGHQHRHQPSRSSLRDIPPHSVRKPLRLQPNALMMDKEIQMAAEVTGSRVVTGMRIPRVTTGQGKWSVWREEARWLGRWAGRKEQNFFFYNLLTAFLGNHTEWLNVLGPKWHRKRHREQQKATSGENLTIANRTVVVSPDKMAARRLIFLLAAFLPPNSPATGDNAAFMRPGTSASLRAYSQSPPSNMPPSRKQSLRRQINRRPKGQQSITNMHLQPPAHQSQHDGIDGTEPLDNNISSMKRQPGHSRSSSTHSTRTSLVVPSLSERPPAGKSSIATTSTATAETTMPIAHFTLPRTRSSGPIPDYRPESSDSLASANLIHTLQRSGTGQTSIASNESSNTSRWSGFMNFWGGRRSSSTDQSDYFQTTDDGIGVRAQERPVSQLEQMVQELSMDGMFGEGEPHDKQRAENRAIMEEAPGVYHATGSSGVPASAARPIPERPKTLDAQLKLSVNEKDGVIEVDIPLPDFDSPLQSPLMNTFGSASSQQGSSFGESSILSLPYCEAEQSVNAAGWLSQFHPDFAIQAIKPYKDIERDVRRAMSAEPTPLSAATTPSIETGSLERWVDVCSALIADTSSFSIKRIRLRRLVKLIPTPTYQPSVMTPGIAGLPPGRSQYGNPYTNTSNIPMMAEVHLEEKFTEERIMDFDATLVDGIDRALAQSGEVTRTNSAQSSRSSSRRSRLDLRAESSTTPHIEVSQADCKGVIFDALETVVKDVTAARNGGAESRAAHEEWRTSKKGPRTATDSSLKEGIRRWLIEVE